MRRLPQATRVLSVLLAAFFFIVAGVGLAAALPINDRPQPIPLLGSESSLQSELDNIWVSGPKINVYADQSPYAVFTNTSSGGSVATFVVEIAGFDDSNQFGLYKYGDPTQTALVFGGGDTSGAQKTVSFLANGNILVNGVLAASGFGNQFGFYLHTPNNTFYTEDDLNGGSPQALVYQGNDSTVLQIPPFAAGTFTDNEFLIAFEDLPFASADRDFNDMVVLVESIRPVPEAGTLLLLGSGLVGIAGFVTLRRRR